MDKEKLAGAKMLVKDLVAKYLASRAASIDSGLVRMLNNYVTPNLDSVALADFDKKKILSIIDMLPSESSKAKGAKAIRALLRYATTQGYINCDPSKRVPPFKHPERSRILSGYELAALFNEAEGMHGPLADCTMTSICTGATVQQLAKANFEDVDFEQNVLRLRVRSGTCSIPLGETAASIIKRRLGPQQKDGPVFCSKITGRNLSGFSGWAKRLKYASEFEDFRLSDIPRSVRTAMKSVGIEVEMLAWIQSGPGIRATEPTSVSEARTAMEAWDAELKRWLAQSGPPRFNKRLKLVFR